MVSMLASSAVDCGFEPWSGQTNNYKTGISCFSNKHTELKSKSRDWLARNQVTCVRCPSTVTCLSADFCFSELAL